MLEGIRRKIYSGGGKESVRDQSSNKKEEVLWTESDSGTK